MIRTLKAAQVSLALQRVRQGSDPVRELEMLLLISLAPAERRALTMVRQAGETESVQLAKCLRININYASMLLKQLADAGLLARSKRITNEGITYVYTPVRSETWSGEV